MAGIFLKYTLPAESLQPTVLNNLKNSLQTTKEFSTFKSSLNSF